MRKQCPCGVTNEDVCYNCPESPFVQNWLQDKWVREHFKILVVSKISSDKT